MNTSFRKRLSKRIVFLLLGLLLVLIAGGFALFFPPLNHWLACAGVRFGSHPRLTRRVDFGPQPDGSLVNTDEQILSAANLSCLEQAWRADLRGQIVEAPTI